LQAGSLIIREGDESDGVYVLIQGEVAITVSGTQVATIRPGGCFGEMIYFTSSAAPRTATAVASSEVSFIEIKAYALRAATDACQVGFNKAFMRVLIDRLAHANRVLAER
jgi:CRP-like cAMP-binding protein